MASQGLKRPRVLVSTRRRVSPLELKATALERADGIATIWLDRPHRHNAWTGRMHTEYRWCLQEADRDPAVGAIVVTGRGSSFCVGGDAQALQGHAERGSYDAGTPDELARPGYGRAAGYLAPAGYDGVEIVANQGYLPSWISVVRSPWPLRSICLSQKAADPPFM